MCAYAFQTLLYVLSDGRRLQLGYYTLATMR